MSTRLQERMTDDRRES